MSGGFSRRVDWVVDYYDDKEKEWVMGNGVVFKGNAIQVEVEDCGFRGDVPLDFVNWDRVRLVECVDGTTSLFDKVVSRSAVNVNWEVEFYDDEADKWVPGIGLKYFAAKNSLKVLVDEKHRSDSQDDEFVIRLVDDDMSLLKCHPKDEPLFFKLQKEIEDMLQDREDGDDEQSFNQGQELSEEEMLAKYKAGDDIEVDWVVDYYDETLNDWIMGNGLIFRRSAMYVEVEDVDFRGNVPLDFSRLRLVEPDGRSRSLFNRVVKNSTIQVDWDVFCEDDDGRVFNAQGTVYQAATNILKMATKDSSAITIIRSVDEDMKLVRCHDEPGSQSMEMFNKLTLAVQTLMGRIMNEYETEPDGCGGDPTTSLSLLEQKKQMVAEAQVLLRQVKTVLVQVENSKQEQKELHSHIAQYFETYEQEHGQVLVDLCQSKENRIRRQKLELERDTTGLEEQFEALKLEHDSLAKSSKKDSGKKKKKKSGSKKKSKEERLAEFKDKDKDKKDKKKGKGKGKGKKKRSKSKLDVDAAVMI